MLIGIIAVQVAIDGLRQQADRTGAVHLVAQTAFGSVILWLLVIGFAARRCGGCPRPPGAAPARTAARHKRLASLARAVFYAVVTYGILKFALGVGQPGSSDSQSQDLTAAAMKHQGGQVIVALAGVAVVIAGLYVIYRE